MAEARLVRPCAGGTGAGRAAAHARAGGSRCTHTDRLRRRQSLPRRLAGNAQARDRRLRRNLSGIQRVPGRGARPHVQRNGRLRRFRAGARHQLQLALRTPHDAVFRQGACGLYAGRSRGGPLEARAPGRCLRTPTTDAGAPDVAGCDGDRRNFKAARRCDDDRSRAHVHVVARGREARRADGDHAFHGCVPRGRWRAGTFHDHAARRAAVSSRPRLLNLSVVLRRPPRMAERRSRPWPHPRTISKKVWRLSPDSTPTDLLRRS